MLRTKALAIEPEYLAKSEAGSHTADRALMIHRCLTMLAVGEVCMQSFSSGAQLALSWMHHHWMVHVAACTAIMWALMGCCMRQVKELGRGQFGSVWLARWLGVEVAVKELRDVSDSRGNAEMLRVRAAWHGAWDVAMNSHAGRMLLRGRA